MHNWRLLTPNEVVSNYLCKQLVEKAVMFQDMTGHIQFRSKYHALAKMDVQHYLQNKMILDVTHQHDTQGQSMPSAAPEPKESAADQWVMPATPRSATPRPTTPGASHTHTPSQVDLQSKGTCLGLLLGLHILLHTCHSQAGVQPSLHQVILEAAQLIVLSRCLHPGHHTVHSPREVHMVTPKKLVGKPLT